MTWRDISTAPKDGTPILVWRASVIPGVRYCDVTAWPNNWTGLWPTAYMHYADGHEPTHWQPLPAPPGSSTPDEAQRSDPARSALPADKSQDWREKGNELLRAFIRKWAPEVPAGRCVDFLVELAAVCTAFTAPSLSDEIASLSVGEEKLRRALEEVRAAITNENGLNSGSVVDTVWVSKIETAVDCIDAALSTDVGDGCLCSAERATAEAVPQAVAPSAVWRPMSEAPRNGVNVWLRVPYPNEWGAEEVLGHWDVSDGPPGQHWWVDLMGDRSGFDGAWSDREFIGWRPANTREDHPCEED